VRAVRSWAARDRNGQYRGSRGGVLSGAGGRDLVGEVVGAAEVEGLSASILAIDEAVVGAEACRAASAVGGDDRADAGEECGVALDEVDRGFGHVRTGAEAWIGACE